MPRGSVLAEVEKGNILALKRPGATHECIKNIMRRNYTTIQSFLASPHRRQQKTVQPRNKTFPDTGHRLRIPKVSRTEKRQRLLQERFGLIISVRCIQKITQETSSFQFNKKQWASSLTKENGAAPINLASQAAAESSNGMLLSCAEWLIPIGRISILMDLMVLPVIRMTFGRNRIVLIQGGRGASLMDWGY